MTATKSATKGGVTLRRVKGHRYLYRRGETLLFRRGVPKHARAAFAGRSEIQISLGTGSVAEARHLLARKLAEFDRILSEASGVRSPAEVLDPQKHEPTMLEVEEGVRSWFAERIVRLSEEVDAIANAERAVDLIQDYEALSANAAAGTRVGGANVMLSDWIVEALVEKFGWRVGPSTPLHRRLTKLVGRGQMELARRFSQEVNGDPVQVLDDTFSLEQYRLDAGRARETHSKTPVSVLALFESYVQERNPARSTVKAWRRQVSAFVAFLAHDDATKVTPEDVVTWKDHLLQRAGKQGADFPQPQYGLHQSAIDQAELLCR